MSVQFSPEQLTDWRMSGSTQCSLGKGPWINWH